MAEKIAMPKCKVCKAIYDRVRPMQVCCSVPCALTLAQGKREKAERVAYRVAKESLKTRGDYIKEAQKEVNRYVRIRDRIAGVPCICCGKYLDWNKPNNIDAGHYRGTGSAVHMRFDTFGNINAQLVHCNRYRAGRALDQAPRIAKRWGRDVLDAIDSDQSSRKWTIPELIEIKEGFRSWANELEREAKKCP
jgi:hypothetical protein